MTESPAETLRRAAERMRAHANAATPGMYSVIAVRDPGPFDFPYRVLARFTGKHGGEASTAVADCRKGDADNIAAMQPAVALLIADMWDEVANVSAFEQRLAGIYSPSAIEARAVAAARAYLGAEAAR